MKKVESIKAYSAATYTLTGGDEVQVNSSNTIPLNNWKHYPTTKRIFGEADVMSLELEPASDWATSGALSFRTRLLVTYDDTSKEMWRISEIKSQHGTSSSYVIEAHSIWTDLRYKLLRYVLQPSYKAVHRLALTGVEFDDALDIIFGANYGMPSFFAKGGVALSLASQIVTLNANSTTFLELIKNLVDQVGCEVEYRYDSGTLYFDFVTVAGLSSAEIANSYTPDPSSRPIHSPTGGGGTSEANRTSLTIEDAQDDFFTRLVPFAGTEEIQVGIDSMTWEVDTVTTVGSTWEIELLGDPIYVDDIYVGEAVIDNLGRTFIVTDSEAPNILTVLHSSLSPVPSTIEFLHIEGTAVLASEGTSLSYVHLPSVEATKGIVEKSVFFPEITPYDNLFVEAGGSGDMSSGVTSGDYLPDGIVKVGSPTTTEETAALYVNHGTSSLKVEAALGEGVQTDEITLAPTAESKYFSFWIGIRVTSGKVRASMVDAEGIVHPVGVDKLDFGSDALLAIQSGGNAMNTGAARLKVVALEANTVFYIDAITITQSVGPYEFVQNMGKKALYREAYELLLDKGGDINPSYSSDFYDINAYNNSLSFAETRPGSYVEIKDNWNGSTFVIDITARVQEIIEDEDPVHGRLRKRVRVERRRPEFVDRVISQGAPPKTEAAPPAVEDQYQTTTTSQSYWLGQAYTAGEVLAGFTSPLRAAASLMSIPGAYLLHSGTIAANATNYNTFTLYNETQDVALGSFSTETAELTSLTPIALTMTSDAESVAEDDVLSVRVSGAGTAVALAQCAIILEVGGKFVPAPQPIPTVLYYSNANKQIRKATIDRTYGNWTSEVIRTSSSLTVVDMCVDHDSGFIFTSVIETGDNNRYIKKSDVVGGAPSTIVTIAPVNASFPPNVRICLDTTNKRIFAVMTNYLTGDKVSVYDYNGVLIQSASFIRDTTSIGAPAVSEDGTYVVYQTFGSGTRRVQKYDFASNTNSDIETSAASVELAAHAFMDHAFGKAFFEWAGADEIRSWPTPGGGSFSTLITTAGSNEYGLGGDRYYRKLYVGTSNNTIKEYGYDGTGERTVIDNSASGSDIQHISLGY